MNTFTNETELLQGINKKNTQALNQFLVPLHAKATYFAYTIVKDNHFAIQAVNDAHLAFIKTPAIFKNLEHAKYYFYSSTRNKALNYIDSADHKNWNNTTGEFPDIRDDTDIETNLAKERILKEILVIMETFPEKYQDIYNLWYTGYTTDETASRVGEGKQYVRNTRNKIFKKILKILKLKNLIMLL
jgi:RNA polymerase sigma factor (sigma-70 family)